MFDQTPDTRHIKELAEFIAAEDQRIEALETELKKAKDIVEQAKEKLCLLMLQQGIDSVKLDNGLTPKAKIQTKFFKAAGVDDAQLFAWLVSVGMGEIIKPHVAWTTLNAALKDYEAQGNLIPQNLITKTEQPTVALFGKTKFNQERNTQ